ncbi:integral membrane ornithine transporter of mitochondria [Scheffersomyces xylosifermentans]|uniref:integral membrane ornithine transporter of mitochondria n=1 Tax=Scheffersomyces xylosifermentans TaxID=1304137 RepID=UPI00315D6BEC
MSQLNRDSTRGGIPAITGALDHSKAFHLFPEELKPFRGSVLAYGATFVSTFLGFPLDTVKTRMQTHKNFTSYFDCVRKTYTREGVRGFFRGIWAPLVSTSFSKSFNVSMFTFVKPYTYNALYRSDDKTVPSHPFIRNIPVCFISGSIAGAALTLFACPFEFTKIYAQLERLVQNKSLKEIPANLPALNQQQTNSPMSKIVRDIVKHEGAKGLYSGFKLHVLRDSLSAGAYYSIYESMKWATNNLINSDPNQQSQVSILLAGGLSGMFTCALVFPVDTTKSLIQKDVVTNILRKEQGLAPLPDKKRHFRAIEKRLYRGLSISMARSFIVNMVFFSVYELSMAHIA